jgi:hypothetical protein
MAAPARVPLGHDQHVLAERGQLLAAERAAVGGRLAILGPADDPPPGAVDLGHGAKDRTASCGAEARYRRRVEQRDERIIVETARYRITGLLRLPKDGYRSRLTDYLNAAERVFLPLTDVEIEPLDSDNGVERRAFVALSLNQIVIAMPADANVSGE